jgi:hypothetical protein
VSGAAARGWRVRLTQDAASVLEAMRSLGHVQLHGELTNFLRALALEAGAAYEAGKSLPGTRMGTDRYNVDVFRLPVLISYSAHPDPGEIRVVDLVWLTV